MDNSNQMSESISVAVLLTLSGGLMDAYSYICRGQVFANAQTGNILLFGVNLSMGKFGESMHYFFPVLAFALGIATAELARAVFKNKRRFHWRQLALLIETVILASVAFMPQGWNPAANALTSFVCGIQVESFRRVNGSGVATTMCIGNLRSAIQKVFEYRFTRNQKAKNEGLLYFSIIAIFTAGAVIGNFLVGIWHEYAILASAVLVLSGLFIMFADKTG